MYMHISGTSQETGILAAEEAARTINSILARNGEASIILATGASQFAMLEHLLEIEIDWSLVHIFHLDEYIGLPETHPASFRKYLYDRFISKLSTSVNFYPVNGNASDPNQECKRLSSLMFNRHIHLACIGIGENGHLAFNDPPADFDIEDPYIVVNLDKECRTQQLGEGWFRTLADVPQKAISMSIRQIMKSEKLVCTVPDLRKAPAVQRAVEGPVTNHTPASILQLHPDCSIYLDNDSASLLTR